MIPFDWNSTPGEYRSASSSRGRCGLRSGSVQREWGSLIWTLWGPRLPACMKLLDGSSANFQKGLRLGESSPIGLRAVCFMRFKLGEDVA